MSSVLMVCLGNICRSPLAEGILRKKTQELSLNITIDSAGTSDNHVGQHPDKRSILNAKKHDIDISKLKAREFKVSDFDTFDYIYVMDSYNHANVIALARNENDRKKVELILNIAFPNSNKAVPDPYYGGEKEFEQVFQLLNTACEKIARSL
jgi:protein-tyrosine phosphatase